MAEAKRGHLEMLQGVVNRLSQNSFLLKGWSVILLSSLFALATLESQPWFIYLTFLPVLSFWGLDAFFLRQERLFRKLYDQVRTRDDDGIDFSMNTADLQDQVSGVVRVAFSKTLLAFHGTLVGTVLLVMTVVIFRGLRYANG